MALTIRSKEFVFQHDRPFASSHASTVTVAPNGDILVAWFGGSEEGAKDVAIWYARKKKGEKAWLPPEKVADLEGVPHWNPVLFTTPTDGVVLYYKVGHTIPKWSTMVMNSQDDGHTWSLPKPLVEGDQGGRGPVRNKPIVLQDGTLLAPASLETETDWDAFVDISADGGRTWTKSGFVPIRRESLKGKGVIQPTLWESQTDHVHMLLRSTNGRIYRSDSQDGGRTWCMAYSTQLPNNNSGIDLTKLTDGTLVLAYNPIAENWGPRTPLAIAVSVDNGASWEQDQALESGTGEFSYPAVISTQGDEIMVTYTWKRESIRFCRLLIKK